MEVEQNSPKIDDIISEQHLKASYKYRTQNYPTPSGKSDRLKKTESKAVISGCYFLLATLKEKSQIS